MDDWEHASKLLAGLSAAKLDPLTHAPVAAGIAGLIRRRLAPSLAVLYPQGNRGPCILSRKVLPPSAPELLENLSPQVLDMQDG